MKGNTVEFPSYSIGKGILDDMYTICKKSGTNAIIIGGKKALEETKAKIEKALVKGNIKIQGTFVYGKECSKESIERLVYDIKNENIDEIDYIIAVGGGKAIDTAKGVASKLNVDVFTVPTIASTCAATTALSVVYNEDGSFDTFYFYDFVPKHIFIDTEILKNAPIKYLRAGMGDTIAKHYECSLASRNKYLNHNNGLAVSMSSMCVNPILEYGEKALKDNQNKESSYEFEQIMLANIITTGMVSLLIEEDYNGALAHSVCYGLSNIEHVEKNNLHGDLVGYGTLVQLILDNKEDDAKKIYEFNKKINIPVSLKELDVECSEEVLEPVIKSILTQPDMEVLPYEINYEMILNSINKLEKN